MQFQSLSFLLFLTVVFFTYWRLSPKYRWILLLSAGYLFYSCWNPAYTALLFGATALSYGTALLLEGAQGGRKKVFLWIFVCIQIGTLLLFKYLGFFSEMAAGLLSLFHLSVPLSPIRLLLPVGISFYLFQTLAYVCDVYRGRIRAERHFGYFAAAVAFFPVLLAGPIERIQDLTVQFREEKRFSAKSGWLSLQRILEGYLKKAVIADSLCVYVDTVYADLPAHAGFGLLLAVFFYSLQIYCDFSGYSDIATGTAGLLGISLNPNFAQPYLADSVKNFWRRWHISLTSWFRDYVYIPLGGNRVGAWKAARNILLTFLLSGLWHGAAWTFVFWGLLHGLLQIAGQAAQKRFGHIRLPKWMKQLWTFLLVSAAWVFFRAESLSDACYVLSHCLTGFVSLGSYLSLGLAALQMHKLQLLLLLFFLILQVGMDISIEQKGRRALPVWILAPLATLALFYWLRYGTDPGAFIYFQF